MLLHNTKKGTWRFKANWTMAAHLVGNCFSDPSVVLEELDYEISRDLLERQMRPRFLTNIELRYSLSDWELNNIPMVLSVDGYIQSDKGHSVDHDNLNRWIPADWIPVENQLRRDPTYKTWSEFNPAFRHVQVSGEPAVARSGPNKKDRKVLLRRLHADSPVSFLNYVLVSVTSVYESTFDSNDSLSPISICRPFRFESSCHPLQFVSSHTFASRPLPQRIGDRKRPPPPTQPHPSLRGALGRGRRRLLLLPGPAAARNHPPPRRISRCESLSQPAVFSDFTSLFCALTPLESSCHPLRFV